MDEKLPGPFDQGVSEDVRKKAGKVWLQIKELRQRIERLVEDRDGFRKAAMYWYAIWYRQVHGTEPSKLSPDDTKIVAEKHYREAMHELLKEWEGQEQSLGKYEATHPGTIREVIKSLEDAGRGASREASLIRWLVWHLELNCNRLNDRVEELKEKDGRAAP